MKVKEFLDAVCRSLNRAPGSLSVDDTPKSVPEWDSVGHLSIIATITEALGIPASDGELQDFDSLGQLVDRLKARGVLEDRP